MQVPSWVVAIAALLAAGAGCGGGGPEAQAREVGRQRSSQAAGAAREAGLPEDAAELIGDAAGAVGRTFTVTYDTGGGGRATLTQAPPRRRFEITLPDGTTRATLVNDQGSFACERRAGPWTCLPSREPEADVGPFAATDLERTIGSLSTAQATFVLRVEPRQVAGVEARCLVTDRKASAADDPALGARGVLCVAPSGAALVLDQPGQALTAVSYRDGADEAAFSLPGPLATTSTAPPSTG